MCMMTSHIYSAIGDTTTSKDDQEKVNAQSSEFT